VSGAEPRAEVLRRIRFALLDLAADGIEWIPSPPSTGAAAAPSPSDAPPAPRSEPVDALPGFGPSAPAPGAQGLEDTRAELGECQRCRLHAERQAIVFGEGSPQAAVVFIGEGPGAEEDRTGRPFVGRAGELLTRMIEAVGWRREDVYICNIIKCRPPNNRAPLADEVAACAPFLEKQLQAITPSVIVTLGKPAISTLLGRNVAITRLRGIWQEWNGIPVMPTYHPAYLLRNYTRETRQAVWDDLRAVRARVDAARAR
jgi:DNA polymerase